MSSSSRHRVAQIGASVDGPVDARVAVALDRAGEHAAGLAEDPEDALVAPVARGLLAGLAAAAADHRLRDEPVPAVPEGGRVVPEGVAHRLGVLGRADERGELVRVGHLRRAQSSRTWRGTRRGVGRRSRAHRRAAWDRRGRGRGRRRRRWRRRRPRARPGSRARRRLGSRCPRRRRRGEGPGARRSGDEQAGAAANRRRRRSRRQLPRARSPRPSRPTRARPRRRLPLDAAGGPPAATVTAVGDDVRSSRPVPAAPAVAAATRAPGVRKRAAGSLATARATTASSVAGRPGTRSETAGGSAWTCAHSAAS